MLVDRAEAKQNPPFTTPDKKTEDGRAPYLNINALWWMTVLAAALVVLGSKLWLISVYGSPTPYWDQWDGEAALLYDPYLGSHFPLSTFFLPHNEHRILFTRLFALGVLEFAGQWDVLLQMVLNAILHTSFMVVLLYLLRDLVSRTEGMLLAVFTTLVFMTPFGWENTLVGFQNQFYFLLFFSCISFVFTLNAAAFTGRWWVGLSLSVVAFFCMASAVFTPLVGAITASLQIAFCRRRGKIELFGIGLQVLLAGIMLHYIPQLDYHEPLRAHSISQYFDALRRSGSWPLRPSDLAPLFIFAPLIALATRIVRKPSFEDASVWLHIAIGGWIIAQHVSLAYGRAVGIDASRYIDLKSLGLIVNFSALISLKRGTGNPNHATAVTLICAAWLSVVVVGLGKTALDHLPTELTGKAEAGRAETKNLSNFLKTGDIRALQDKASQDIPYPQPDRLAQLASLPTIRGILPDSLVDDPAARKAAQRQLFTKGKLYHLALEIRKKGLVDGPYLVFFGVALFFSVGFIAAISPRPSARRV